MNRPVGHVTDLIRRLEKWRGRRAAKSLEIDTLSQTIAYLEEYRTMLNTQVSLDYCASQCCDAIRYRIRGMMGFGLSCQELPFVVSGDDFDKVVEDFFQKFSEARALKPRTV